jgi:hypothetical protein
LARDQLGEYKKGAVMGRRGGFGVGQQGFHPRARGALGIDKTKGLALLGLTSSEMTAQHFVPSFSIMRHLHESEMPRWAGIQKQLGKMLGRHFDVMAPAELAVKSLEQKSLIEKIRQSGAEPSAGEMRDAAYNIRDGLEKVLAEVPEPLEVGLGRLAVFGRKQNKIGFVIDGWKGWKARYSLMTNEGELTAPGTLVMENQVAVGGLSRALPDTEFALNQISTTPHLTLARNADKIRGHELRRIQAQVDELDIESVYVNDPVISFKPAPWERPELIAIERDIPEPSLLRLLA